MKENTKRNWFKTIISAAAIVVICVLLICLLKFRLLARVFEDSNHHTNVPDAQEEIDRIIEETDYSVISFMNVNYYQGVYTVTFFCEKLNINDTAECNKALSESVNAFERIVSGIGASSELYDKRICLKTRINGSLPYNITLSNYEHDYERNSGLPKEPDFKKLVSGRIDFPADDISAVDRHKSEIVNFSLGSNCKASIS